MADVAKAVDKSPPRGIEDGLGLGRAASGEVVVDSEGNECGGSEVRGDVKVDCDGDGDGEGTGVDMNGAEAEGDGETRIFASSVVRIGEKDDDGDNLGNESEFQEEGDVNKGDGVGESELRSELDVDKLDSDLKLVTVVAAEEYGLNDAVEEKKEPETNLVACGDMERIEEASKMVEEENGNENVAGDSNLSGLLEEDCHAEDVVGEIGERFEKNAAEEECAVVTACGDMEQIDQSSEKVIEEGGEESVAGDSDLIGMGMEDCHMSAAVEEKVVEFEKNLAAEQCAVMATDGAMDQIDESRNTFKEEEIVNENAGENSDSGCLVTEDSHMNDAVEEKREEFKTNLAAEQCAVMTAIGDAEQIDESKNTLKEEEVVDETFAGNCDLTGMVVEDSLMNDVVKENGEEFEKNLAVDQCAAMATIGDMDQTDESRNKLTENEVGEQNVTGDSEMIGAEPTVNHIDDSDNVENEGVNGDEEMRSEEENIENKEMLEKYVLAAPDVEFSLHNVVLDTTTGEGDEEFVDGEPSVADAENETQVNGDEEMGSEEEYIENKEKLENDGLASPDVEFSLHNVVLDTTGEGDEEFVDGEPSVADAENDTQVDTYDANKSNIRPKRGRKPSKVALTKKTEEDVCFICFDGGDLVVCDRR